MCDKIKVQVQWPSGAILPVLTKKTSCASELYNLLRFACSNQEEIKLLHNGILLNPKQTLESQNIKENEVVNIIVMPKKFVNKIDPKIQSIVLEAAKISDKQKNLLDKESSRYSVFEEYSSDEDFKYPHYYVIKRHKKKKKKDKTEPLPKFWTENNDKKPDLLMNYLPAKITTIEEAGKFLEKNGWSSWIW